MPPYRLLSCSDKDHEHKEVPRGRLLLHTTHPARQAGPSQGHLRGGQRPPSAGVRSFPSPPGHTSGKGMVPEFPSSEDPFDEWLKERGREVYHFEPAQTLEEDEQVFEAEVG